MKRLIAFIAISIIVTATIGYYAIQKNQLLAYNGAMLKTTLMIDGKTKNIEIEISGLIPNKRFEVSWTDYQCRSSTTKSARHNGFIVISDPMGSLLGYVDVNKKLKRQSILVTNIENGKHMCFDANV